MLIYSCILVIIATINNIFSYAGKESYYIQHCVVVLGITFLSNLIANELYKYQQRIELLTKTSSENEEMYRKRLERDLLTGVHSREYMQEIFHKHFGIKYSKEPVGVAILDLDNFKRINDKYGHDNGDIVLRTLGTLLNEYASPTLQVGRFGGEEFVIIFLDTNQKDYYTKLEELRVRFSNQDFDFMDEHVTFSAGLVICTSNVAYDKAFQHADQALYESKGNGKNQITVVDL
jgi:diguanylate cyclase (GGDEF)-like protein